MPSLAISPLCHTNPMTLRAVCVAAVVCLFAFATPASAADRTDLPPALQELVDAGQAACAAFENGTFKLEWGAVERVDLDGDRQADWVLNERGFVCSSAASLYCGTGGCHSNFLVGDTVQSTLNRGWRVIDFGQDRVVLTDVHGSQCGGINPTPCVAASVWDSEANVWRSTGALWQ